MATLSFDRRSWPSFLALLRFHAQSQGLWDQINPDAPIVDTPSNYLATPPTLDSVVSEENKRRLADYEASYSLWEEAQDRERGPSPEAPTLATSRDKALKDRFEELRKDYPAKAAHLAYQTKAFASLNKWIEAHVDRPLLIAAMQIAGNSEGSQSTRTLVKTLRDLVAPTAESIQSTIRDDYRRVLRRARSTGIKPIEWLGRFQEAYLNALAYQIHDVLEESYASREFLYAVGTLFQQTWARNQIEELTRNDALGNPQTMRLNDYIRWFGALISDERSEDQFGTYATLNGRGRNEPSEGKECPCGSNPYHRWGPERCLFVEYALNKRINEDFSRGTFRPPSEERINDILKRLEEPKWASLHEKLGGGSGKSTYPGTLKSG